MGYDLIKFLPGVDANRKLFYMDNQSGDLPPIYDEVSIRPGSVAIHPPTLTKYILATNFTWVKYVGEQKPTDPPLPVITGGQEYWIIAYMDGTDADRKLYYLDNGLTSLAKLNAEQDMSHVPVGSQATDIRTGKRWVKKADNQWHEYKRESGGGGGGTGVDDKNFVHAQTTPAQVWTINHGLSKYCSIVVVDDAGNVLWPSIKYIDLNTIEVNFGTDFETGKCYCN